MRQIFYLTVLLFVSLSPRAFGERKPNWIAGCAANVAKKLINAYKRDEQFQIAADVKYGKGRFISNGEAVKLEARKSCIGFKDLIPPIIWRRLPDTQKEGCWYSVWYAVEGSRQTSQEYNIGEPTRTNHYVEECGEAPGIKWEIVMK